jgi:hypothetical protein
MFKTEVNLFSDLKIFDFKFSLKKLDFEASKEGKIVIKGMLLKNAVINPLNHFLEEELIYQFE